MKSHFAGNVFILIVLTVLLLSACGSSPSPDSPTPVGGIGFNLDQDEPDSTTKPQKDADGCPLRSMRLTSQHIKTVSSIVFEDADLPQGVDRLRITISSGTYNLRMHPVLGANCNDAGPETPVITVDFAVDYHAEVDHSIQPACVHRSRGDFSKFDVKNSPAPLDQFILDQAKDSILESIDEQTASTLNALYFSVTPEPNADLRCQWSELPS